MLSTILSKNWLIHRIIRLDLEKCISRYATGATIDVGCGKKPYEELLEPFVQSYVGLDHRNSCHDITVIDLIGSAYEIPVENNSFDTVLCTDVLEHLEEPALAVQEAYRILKTGGYAIYTVPLYWHIHEEPRDFYRYTEFGVRYLFEKAGFTVIEIMPLTGFIVTFCQELVYYIFRFRKGGRVNPFWWLVPIVGSVIQVFAYVLNKIDHSERFTAEYRVVAQKSVVVRG